MRWWRLRLMMFRITRVCVCVCNSVDPKSKFCPETCQKSKQWVPKKPQWKHVAPCLDGVRFSGSDVWCNNLHRILRIINIYTGSYASGLSSPYLNASLRLGSRPERLISSTFGSSSGFSFTLVAVSCFAVLFVFLQLRRFGCLVH